MLLLLKCEFIKHISKSMTAFPVNKKEKEVQRRLKVEQKWKVRSPRTSAEEAASLWVTSGAQTLLGSGLGVGGPVSAAHVLHAWTLLESAPWWGLPVFTLAAVFTSCGASVDTVVLCFSSLHCARPSLERELCYYLRKSGSGSAMWFEGKISCIFFLLVIF